MEENLEEFREKFLRSYPNIPESLRAEIIVIIDKKPYTWSSAYFEINNNTSLGKIILKRLIDTKII
jgi:hypothetical protein